MLSDNYHRVRLVPAVDSVQANTTDRELHLQHLVYCTFL